MKRKIGLFAATLGLGLLMTAGSATATPFEPCEFDGQTGYTYGSENGLNGWHLWQCAGGAWYYQAYCGPNICIV